eukprot:2513030-Rhodomonas_salina.1
MHFLLVLCTLVLVPVNPSHSNHGTNTVLGVLRLLPAGTTASHSVVTLVPISPTTSTAHHRKAALLVVLQQHPSHPRYFVQDTRVCTYPVVNLKHADRNFEIRNSLPVAWHWHAPSGYPGTGVDFLPPGHGTRVPGYTGKRVLSTRRVPDYPVLVAGRVPGYPVPRYPGTASLLLVLPGGAGQAQFNFKCRSGPARARLTQAGSPI